MMSTPWYQRNATDQDSKCYCCGKRFRSARRYTVAVRDEETTVYVGPDCYSQIVASGDQGYGTPKLVACNKG
jgi:hypothetical protein